MYTNTEENPLIIYIARSIRALIKSVLRPTISGRLFIAGERQAPRCAPSRRCATSIAPSLSFEAVFGETFCVKKNAREVGRSNEVGQESGRLAQAKNNQSLEVA
jgi:hypothetical protein